MNEQTKILALETSCDETSVSVIENGQTILSNSVLSQIESHQRFGGVVPEVASRHHVENITVMIEEALQQAHTSIEDVDAVAVTQGPGLIGALLVGVNAAKALAFANDKPLIPVHHIAGHVYANQLQSGLKFPLIALIVSGGHTELVYMENHLQFEVIGKHVTMQLVKRMIKLHVKLAYHIRVALPLTDWPLKGKTRTTFHECG